MERYDDESPDPRITSLSEYKRRKNLEVTLEHVKETLRMFGLPEGEGFQILMFCFIQDMLERPSLEESEYFRHCREFVFVDYQERVVLYDQLRDRAVAFAIHMPSFEMGVFQPSTEDSSGRAPQKRSESKRGELVDLAEYRKKKEQKKK